MQQPAKSKTEWIYALKENFSYFFKKMKKKKITRYTRPWKQHERNTSSGWHNFLLQSAREGKIILFERKNIFETSLRKLNRPIYTILFDLPRSNINNTRSFIRPTGKRPHNLVSIRSFVRPIGKRPHNLVSTKSFVRPTDKRPHNLIFTRSFVRPSGKLCFYQELR